MPRGACRRAGVAARILGETPVPRLAWIGEPTSYAVCHAHKSIVSFSVTIRGKGGIAGAREGVQRDSRVMARVIRYYRALAGRARQSCESRVRGDFPTRRATCSTLELSRAASPRTSSPRSASCVLAIGRCLTLIRWRYIARSGGAYLCWIGMIMRATKIRREIEVGAAMVVPPLNSPRGTALEAGAIRRDRCEEQRRRALWYRRRVGLPDSNIVTLICGPGDLDQAHQPNEYVRRRTVRAGDGDAA